MATLTGVSFLRVITPLVSKVSPEIAHVHGQVVITGDDNLVAMWQRFEPRSERGDVLLLPIAREVASV